MNHDHYDDKWLKAILENVKTIAVVGASANPARPSYGVMKFLLEKGYHVIPVNPGLAGKDLQGQKTYAKLADIPEKIDMVDVFRSADHLAELMEEVLALDEKPDVIWGQLSVRNDEVAATAEAASIQVVMDRCPAIEYRRLIG